MPSQVPARTVPDPPRPSIRPRVISDSGISGARTIRSACAGAEESAASDPLSVPAVLEFDDPDLASL
eukprot:scaffold52584_cov63-Phaeocystis_antarctica.AAC.3